MHHICMYAIHMYLGKHPYMYVCRQICMHICVYVSMYVCACMYVDILV